MRLMPADMPTAVPRSSPKRSGRSWWWHPRGGPRARASAAISAVAAVAAIAVSTAYTNQTVRTVIGDQTNTYGDTYVTYQSSDGAPGQGTPRGSRECGDIDSDIHGGWGPDRPTFTIEHPPGYTTLNAIRDNPNYGDERGLMVVKDAANHESGGWQYSVDVERGHTYMVRIYVENSTIDGASDLASAGTTLMVNLPTCTGNVIASNGFVQSDTAFPMEIWGGVTFRSEEIFNLAYIEDSASLVTNAHPGDGLPIAKEFLTTQGVLLGYEAQDGLVLPGYQYSMYFFFEVRPQFAA